uniref:Uncharacterized protein n=1 Tax=Romanomermis culicivorax TaxID=13658 RepID=A0A915KYH5_ROMCU
MQLLTMLEVYYEKEHSRYLLLRKTKNHTYNDERLKHAEMFKIYTGHYGWGQKSNGHANHLVHYVATAPIQHHAAHISDATFSAAIVMAAVAREIATTRDI